MTSTTVSIPDLEALLKDGSNKSALTCLHCPSRILNASVGRYVEKQFSLPSMTKEKSQTEANKDDLKDFWKVSDMFHFENVGFSHTADGVKYLTCADCEMGPIGWHDLQTKENFVALSRVKNS